MTAKKTEKEETNSGINLGLGGIFSGLGELVGKLSDLAEKGKELHEIKEIKGLNKKLGGVCGFSIKIGGLGGEGIKVEPFGNIHKDEEGTVHVDELREPLTDIFEEKDHTLIVAEMPGVDEKDIQVDLKEDILDISAEGDEKKYHKEILLKESFAKEKMERSYKNGILKLKLKK